MKKLVVLLFLLGVAARTWYFLYPLGKTSFFTVDEAVYGVQSLQILEGDRPVFYPAQVYTGSFSAYISATLYFLLGFRPIFLKLVPFIFSLLLIYLNYALARRVFADQSATVLTLFITALATPFWNNWASRAGTGYVEATTIGSLMLLLALKLSSEGGAGRRNLIFFVFGILAGLGFWVQPTIVYYLIPSLIYLSFDNRRSLLSKSVFLFPLGFLIGDLPAVLYNLTHSSATVQTLFKMPWGVKVSLWKLITEGFPVIIGGRTSNSRLDFFTPLAVLIELLFAVSVFHFLYLSIRWLFLRVKSQNYFLVPTDLVLMTFVSTIFVFLLSTPFNQFSIEPRYVFSLYSTLPLIAAYFLSLLLPRRKILFSAVLILYLANWSLGLFLANPLTFNDRYRVDRLVFYLKEHSIKNLISDQVLGHRIMFLSRLSILTAIRGGGITQERFPEINQEVVQQRDLDNFSVSFVVVKDSPEAEGFESESRGFLGDQLQKEIVDENFVVIIPKKL